MFVPYTHNEIKTWPSMQACDPKTNLTCGRRNLNMKMPFLEGGLAVG
jgi:hypothetical protein